MTKMMKFRRTCSLEWGRGSVISILGDLIVVDENNVEIGDNDVDQNGGLDFSRHI